ncbi:SpoIIE family protein phosphatase [Streptomyces sp. NPDC060048]|uniref:SpoIIE family protein phosphatase n=1 Tax=unclassified Streptomyces TaxID=2593676 RepID=UPI0036B3C58A
MASRDALLVVDTAGVVVAWSQEAESLFGHEAFQALGRPVAELLAESWPLADADTDTAATADAHVGGRFDRTSAASGLVVRPMTLEDGDSGWSVDRLLPDDEEAGADDADDADDADGQGEALLHALFTQSPIGMQVLDPQLRVLRVNTAASGMNGLNSARLLGLRLNQMFRLSDPDETEAMVRDVLATGEPALNRLVRACPPSDPEREHVYSVSVFRLEDADGRVLGASTAVVDVTSRERSLARERVLNTARERVGQSLDLDATCAALVDVLVPAFADAAEVDLLDPVVHGQDFPPAPVGPGVPLRRMAFAAADGQRNSLSVDTGSFRFPAAWLQSLTDLRPHLVTYHPDVADADPQASRTTRRSGAHSAIVTPLTLRNGVCGTLSLYRSPPRQPFVDEDLGLALEMSARTALHIDNARRYTREHTIALTLQRRLLPSHPEPQSAAESAHFHQSVEAGGGWFDMFPLSGARIALTVGRVVGTGIHAAMAMGQLRTAIHTLASLDLEPDELLARLDDTVGRLASERAGLPSGDPLRNRRLLVHCLYGVYDPLDLSCAFAVAGNPRPVIAHPGGTTESLDVPVAPPLGSGEESPFACARLHLPERSVIALHTDAFLRAGGDDGPTGQGRLREVLADSGRSLDDLCDEAVRTVPGSPPAVDAILLLVRTQALAPGRVCTWELPPDPAAIATARARTRRQLAAWGLDELSLTTELIVSELATNAVRYGTPPLTLRLINGDRTLAFEVSDSSPVSPHLRHAQTSDEGGRGLFICAELTQAWGVRFGENSKTIWTEQALPPRGLGDA